MSKVAVYHGDGGVQDLLDSYYHARCAKEKTELELMRLENRRCLLAAREFDAREEMERVRKEIASVLNRS